MLFHSQRAEIQHLENYARDYRNSIIDRFNNLEDESLDAVQAELYYQVIERMNRVRALLCEVNSRLGRINKTHIKNNGRAK